LLSYSEDIKLEGIEIEAALHGIDMKKTMEKQPRRQTVETKDNTTIPDLPKRKGEVDLPYKFGDPKSYAHLSPEEKEELTKKMMNAHRRFVTQTKILGGD
jgi:hypothetical protein